MAQITSDYIRLKKLTSNPPQPPAGEVYFFAKEDGKISLLDDTNTEVNMSGSAVVLNDLDDFTITTPSEGQYIRYLSGGWSNTAFPLVPSVINDFSDVDTAGAINTDIVMYTTAFKPKGQKACVFAETTAGITVSALDTGHKVTTSHANVSTGGDSGLLGADYFQFLNDGGDLDDNGAHILESTFILSCGTAGTVWLTPISITGAVGASPSTNEDPTIIVTLDGTNDEIVHVAYTFFPPQTATQFSWNISNNINAVLTYNYVSTFRPFGHNTANSALF